ncbi:hypothetical protein KLP40_13870 [Hymenobacter sp. NST-14]|uniref:hypothetical protein n=1 Tax=Hymenobacter piscis TaxID=2839984 RepID=UPI001C039E7D|nr:hypothetical protein [Hymenobacter piscis]MBT9394254.1 hypothetical protein [Hymenobacter piscis]
MSQIKIRVKISKTISILTWAIVFVVAMGILTRLIPVFTPYQTAFGLIALFDMDSERTIPAYLSALNLGFAALLLTLITHIKKSLHDAYWLHWLLLSLGFGYLSIDEAVSLHELLTQIIKDHNPTLSGVPFHYIIAIMGFTVVALLLLFYGNFLKHLQPQDRLRFTVAGALFVTGAFGIEAIGGYIVTHLDQLSTDLIYVEVVIEESMEMFGILLFIRALLIYIKDLAPATRREISHSATVPV